MLSTRLKGYYFRPKHVVEKLQTYDTTSNKEAQATKEQQNRRHLASRNTQRNNIIRTSFKFKDSRTQEKPIRLDIYVKTHESIPTANTIGLTRKYIYKKTRRIYRATKIAVLNVNFKYSPSQKHILA